MNFEIDLQMANMALRDRIDTLICAFDEVRSHLPPDERLTTKQRKVIAEVEAIRREMCELDDNDDPD